MKYPLLSISHLTKSFEGHTALKSISLDVRQGTLFGLVGPNGAGKTTLLRIITGIYIQDSGQVNWPQGKPVIGYLPEERGLYRKMKVEEQLIYLGRLRNMSKAEAKEQAHQWTARMGLSEWRNRPVGDLSKGMQQKVQFIAAVLHKPTFLILDEPFSGFDPVNAEVFKQEILRLKDEGVTIIFSTHRMESVDELCEDVALINHSEVVEQGGLAQLKARYDPQQYVISAKQNITLPDHVTMIAHKKIEDNHHYTLQCTQEEARELLKKQLDNNIEIASFAKKEVTMQELFLKLVEGSTL